MDWYAVRKLKSERELVEEKIENLRGQTINITHAFKEIPSTRSLNSRLEKIAIEIMEMESRRAEIDKKISAEQVALAEYIYTHITDAQLQKILYLRFVHCLSLRGISEQMNCSRSRIQRLMEKYFKKN